MVAPLSPEQPKPLKQQKQKEEDHEPAAKSTLSGSYSAAIARFLLALHLRTLDAHKFRERTFILSRRNHPA
jgi:hypothetical protein